MRIGDVVPIRFTDADGRYVVWRWIVLSLDPFIIMGDDGDIIDVGRVEMDVKEALAKLGIPR